MTELEKQIAVARLYGYEIDGETATYQDMDESISGSCHVSDLYIMRDPDILKGLLDQYDLQIWEDISSNMYLATEDGKKFISNGQTYYDKVFNALAEASKHILA